MNLDFMKDPECYEYESQKDLNMVFATPLILTMCHNGMISMFKICEELRGK